MNQPTDEQIQGMVMYSMYLDSTKIYDNCFKVEVDKSAHYYRISAFYGEGDWMFTSVIVPNPFKISELDSYIDNLILKLNEIIKENNL